MTTIELLRDAHAAYRDAAPEDQPAMYDKLRAVCGLPPVEPLTTPCQSCDGPHRLIDCAGIRAADMLAAAGLDLHSDRVRGRAVPVCP